MEKQQLIKAGFAVFLLAVLCVGLGSTAAIARGPNSPPGGDCPTATCPAPNGMYGAGTCVFIYPAPPHSNLECATYRPFWSGPATCYDPNNCHWQ